MNRGWAERLTTRTCAGLVALVLLLLAGGCALDARVGSKGPAAVRSGQAGPSVTGFADGRKGFVLSETVELDAQQRRDFDRAVEHLNAQAYDEAIVLLKPLVESAPRVSAPYIDLAIAYHRLGQPEPAEVALKAALALVPAHPVASNEYGLLLRKAGRFSEAKALYEQALARFPDYLPVRKNLGILCDLYLNDPACALAAFEEYSVLDPGDEQVKLWVSELRLRSGQE